MTEKINCLRGCCQLKFIPYTPSTSPFIMIKRSRRKAGILITNTEGKILLVQSKGNLWGCPKGTMKSFESEMGCAIREVKEETGIQISEDVLYNAPKYTHYRTKGTYFYIEIPHQNLEVQTHIHDNDANGIGWINLHCLIELIEIGKISVNHHCRIVIERFLGVPILKNFY